MKATSLTRGKSCAFSHSRPLLAALAVFSSSCLAAALVSHLFLPLSLLRETLRPASSGGCLVLTLHGRHSFVQHHHRRHCTANHLLAIDSIKRDIKPKSTRGMDPQLSQRLRIQYLSWSARSWSKRACNGKGWGDVFNRIHWYVFPHKAARFVL